MLTPLCDSSMPSSTSISEPLVDQQFASLKRLQQPALCQALTALAGAGVELWKPVMGYTLLMLACRTGYQAAIRALTPPACEEQALQVVFFWPIQDATSCCFNTACTSRVF